MQKPFHIVYLSKMFFIILSALLTVEALYIYLSLWQYEKNKFASEQKELNLLISEASSVPNTIYDAILNKPLVLGIMQQANSSVIDEKNQAREILFEFLKEDYELFKKRGIQQLHFHLPNNESFLRFHKPDKFGDNLTKYRASVKLTNQLKKFTFGFEEGRVFNGYRFVYPLINKAGRHLGSVEISKSLLSFKKEYESTNRHIDFLLKKSVVQNKLFKDQLQNYTTSSLNDQFLLQKTLHTYNQTDQHAHAQSRDAIYNRLSQSSTFAKHLNKAQRFMQIEWFGLNAYSVKVLPLKNNFTKNNVGHILIFSKSDYFELYKEIHVTLTITIIILSLIMAMAFVFNRSKQRVQSHAEKLRLLNDEYIKTNKLLDSIINGTEDLIFYKDKHFRYLGCNSAFAELVNLQTEEICNKTDSEIFTKKLALDFRKDDKTVIDTQKIKTIYERVKFPSGKEGFYYTQKIPFAYNSEHDIGILGIARDITALHETEQKLKALSTTDELTGLQNRKAYNQNLSKAFTNFNRYQTPFSVVMLDIDNFKAVNDQFGHITGDKVLQAVAKTMQAITRENDSIYRIGGEEFMVLLPNTKLNASVRVAEKIKMALTELNVSPVECCTASFGVSEAQIDDTSDTIFKRVDDLLYKAKAEGKDQIQSL